MKIADVPFCNNLQQRLQKRLWPPQVPMFTVQCTGGYPFQQQFERMLNSWGAGTCFVPLLCKLQKLSRVESYGYSNILNQYFLNLEFRIWKLRAQKCIWCCCQHRLPVTSRFFRLGPSTKLRAEALPKQDQVVMLPLVSRSRKSA